MAFANKITIHTHTDARNKSFNQSFIFLIIFDNNRFKSTPADIQNCNSNINQCCDAQILDLHGLCVLVDCFELFCKLESDLQN